MAGEVAVELAAQGGSVLTAADRGAGHHYMFNPDLLRLIDDLIKVATETFMAQIGANIDQRILHFSCSWGDIRCS